MPATIFMPNYADPRRDWRHVGGDLEASYDGAKYVDFRDATTHERMMFASRGTLRNAVKLIIDPITEAKDARRTYGRRDVPVDSGSVVVIDPCYLFNRREWSAIVGEDADPDRMHRAIFERLKALLGVDWLEGAYLGTGGDAVFKARRRPGGGVVVEDVRVDLGDVLGYTPSVTGDGGFTLTDSAGVDHFFIPREGGMFYDGWGRDGGFGLEEAGRSAVTAGMDPISRAMDGMQAQSGDWGAPLIRSDETSRADVAAGQPFVRPWPRRKKKKKTRREKEDVAITVDEDRPAWRNEGEVPPAKLTKAVLECVEEVLRFEYGLGENVAWKRLPEYRHLMRATDRLSSRVASQYAVA